MTASERLRHAVGQARARWYLRAAIVHPSVRVHHPGKVIVHRGGGTIIIGRDVTMSPTVAPIELGAIRPGSQLHIGCGTFINSGVSILAEHYVLIGRGVLIGPHVTILDNQKHGTDPRLRHEPQESLRVYVGDNVWIGPRAFIMPGVTVGRDSVVAAGSVVTHDVPPGTLVGGAPARVLRTFNLDHVTKLCLDGGL